MMNKQAVEEELNEIFNLFKACIDKDHLVKLCEQRGLIVNASILKQAEEHQEKFASVYSNLLSVGASERVLLDTVLAFHNSFGKEAKHVRPKKDPTQDKIQKKHEKENKTKEKKVPTSLGKVWDKYFLMEMSKRYGDWVKSKESFVNEEGQPLVKITGYSGIQDYIYSQVSKKIGVMPRGEDVEEFAQGILTYMFFPKAVESSRKSFYDEVDVLLEEAKKDKKLPLEIAGLLKTVAKRRVMDYIEKHVNKQFADEVAIGDQEDYIQGLRRKLQNAKSDETKKAVEKQIEAAEARLRGLQKAFNQHSAPLEYDPGTVHKHPYVEDEISYSGERILFSPSDVDRIADIKELLHDMVEKEDLQVHFGKFLKQKADEDTFQVYKHLINNENMTVQDRAELSEDLELSPKAIGVIAGKLKGFLAQYAFESDDISLLDALESRDLLPAKYKIKKKSSLTMLEEKVASLESQVYMTLEGDDNQKNILLSSIKELGLVIKNGGKSDTPETNNKVGKIVEYLEALSQKL